MSIALPAFVAGIFAGWLLLAVVAGVWFAHQIDKER